MAKRKTAPLVTVFFIIIIASLCIVLTLSGMFNEKTRMPSGLWTESGEGVPPIFQNHTLGVSVLDKDDILLKNVWVVVFDDGVARLFGYTDSDGAISFELLPGDYVVQFEKYHYTVASRDVMIADRDVNMTQTMEFEEQLFFGALPSWVLVSIFGIVLFGLAYWNRKSLKLKGFRKSDAWFGSSPEGSWTFIDKSTKSALYGVSFALLVMLLIVVMPNFPTFQSMAIYYVVIGVAALLLLFIEGSNKKMPVAAIGFGRLDEVIGNVLVGIAFALLFVGLTGFMSQLCIPFFSASVGSVISILMVVIVASYFETLFFLGILAPTIAEKGGMLPSIFFTSILFMFAHSLSYGMAFLPMLSAFTFNAFATGIVLQRKSWFGIFIAHAVINALSLLPVAMFS